MKKTLGIILVGLVMIATYTLGFYTKECTVPGFRYKIGECVRSESIVDSSEFTKLEVMRVLVNPDRYVVKLLESSEYPKGVGTEEMIAKEFVEALVRKVNCED